MEKKELIYKGKSKLVYSTDDPSKLIMSFQDEATAFKGIKKAIIKNKGIINNRINEIVYQELQKEGIPTHFISVIGERDMLCQKVELIPLEMIVRNLVAGSMSKRLNIKEGTDPGTTVYELCYKDDALGDPIINDYHAVALKAATFDELKVIYDISDKVNKFLFDWFDKKGIVVVDIKLEFGKLKDGTIILADEITPDTCRFWDKKTLKKLDKDRFRRDLGDVEEAYEEILKRISA